MAEPSPAAKGAGFDIRTIFLIAGVSVIIIIALLFLFFRGCAPSIRGDRGYTVIYSNLELKDAANVIAGLKELDIPYEIRENGHAIAVPKDKSDQARLGLAEKNLPAGGVVGWEIFDESRLGATDFDRRIQLIRAISGELSRTIRQIETVEDARVQIVLPETRLFAETVAPVTASVMLRLKPGAELSPEKVNGIIHLVASSVENLQPQNVTIIDDTGRILSAKVAQPMEETLESITEEPTVLLKVEVSPEAIEEMMATPEVVIPGEEIKISAPVVSRELTPEEKLMLRAQAKRKLELDLSGKAQEILNRFYPLNSAIIKVNIELKDSLESDKFKEEELKINKMTAIILIDNRIELTQDIKQSTFKAVAAAIGYNRNRGDKIVMQKVPFHLATPAPETLREEVEKALPPKKSGGEWGSLSFIISYLQKNIFWVIIGAAVILIIFYLFGRRPKKKGLRAEPEPESLIPETKMAPVNAEKMSAIENIKSAAEKNPERIAELLKNWLSEKK
jgi:flagellar M-ring protein FliF